MIKDIDLGSLIRKSWKDFLFFLSNPVPLSFSKMGTYQTCAYKYKLIYHDHIPGKPSPYLAYGSVMHDTLFEFESIPARNGRNFDDIERIFKKNWDIHVESYRQKWGKSIYELIAGEKNTPAEELEREAFDMGIMMLKNYWRDSQKSPNKVRGVEKWLFGEIGKHHVTGRLDRLDQRPDGAYEIIDYKTGQRIYNEETLKDASRGYGLQAGLYYEMCREAWRDRVARFVFRYLQKRQTFVDYLIERWSTLAHDAGKGGLASGARDAATPDTASQVTDLTAATMKALREKLEEKISRKVVAEAEEERIRGEIKKILLDEEDRILEKIDEPDRRVSRLFIKDVNRSLEQTVNERVKKVLEDKETLAKYENDVRKVIREVLQGLDEPRIQSLVTDFLTRIEKEFRGRAASADWMELVTPERERIAGEIFEIIHHREVQTRTEKYLRVLTPESLEKKVRPVLESMPEIRADRRLALVRHVLDRLQSEYARKLDMQTAIDVAASVASSAPGDILGDEYRKRTEKMLDRTAELAKVRDASAGRLLTEETRKALRENIIRRPLTEAVKKIIVTCVDGVIDEILSGRPDRMTPELRTEYRRLVEGLADPQFVRSLTQKVSTAYARQLFYETYFQKGVVPIVDHATRLFERPDVMKILDGMTPGMDTLKLKQNAQRLIEKLDWRDAEVLVDETLAPAMTAWTRVVESLMSPAMEAAVRENSQADAIERMLTESTELFENRLLRVSTLDVEVPYSQEMRENVFRAIEGVQEGIRRCDFSTSRGALCGWCEYQSGCPAWCTLKHACKNICKGEYNCQKWLDEKTGKLRTGRPSGMSAEEHMRRVSDKFEVTDRSLFRLSFSKMNTYELCPMNYRKLYLDKTAPKPKSFFSIGLSYHQTMEDLYAYDGPRKQPSLDMLLDIFKKKWISAGYRSRPEEDFNFRRGLRMCEDYYAEYIDQKYKPAGAMEDYFEFTLGRTLLCGFIDRVDTNKDGSITIVDYKTNPKLYTQDELEEDQQMTIYYLAAREGKLSSTDYKPTPVKKFVFQFVNFCKDLATYRKPADLDALLDRVSRFTEEMERRQKKYKDAKFDPRVGMLLFPPSDNKYCQSCDHHHICPLKTDMTLSGEVQKKGIQAEDAALDAELVDESPERSATIDVG